jgi:uncharacterized protein YjiS (DUF1127 family)
MRELSEQPSQSCLARVARWWRNWAGNRQGRAELQALTSEELGQLARDVGIGSTELRTLAGKWPDSAALLDRRMVALHLDPDAIGRSQPAVTRDMQRLCSLCRGKRTCEHDLDNGAVQPRWRRYCPNSTTLMALVSEQHAKQPNPKKT